MVADWGLEEASFFAARTWEGGRLGNESDGYWSMTNGLLSLVCVFVAAISMAVGAVSVRAADIVGVIGDANGTAVPGVEISVQDLGGKQIAKTISDAAGKYEVKGLRPGTYNLVARGQSGVLYVGDEGTTVNWGIAPGVPPVAVARRGTRIPSSPPEHDRRPVSPTAVEQK
jgi:hypothetical protein